jgi:hypothetical protein
MHSYAYCLSQNFLSLCFEFTDILLRFVLLKIALCKTIQRVSIPSNVGKCTSLWTHADEKMRSVNQFIRGSQ